MYAYVPIQKHTYTYAYKEATDVPLPLKMCPCTGVRGSLCIYTRSCPDRQSTVRGVASDRESTLHWQTLRIRQKGWRSLSRQTSLSVGFLGRQKMPSPRLSPRTPTLMCRVMRLSLCGPVRMPAIVSWLQMSVESVSVRLFSFPRVFGG